MAVHYFMSSACHCRGFERALPSESEERELVAAQRACAWYHVTYAQPYSNYSGPYNSQVPFMPSFPCHSCPYKNDACV